MTVGQPFGDAFTPFDDDDRVVEYWNSIDEDLELDMDVLDDLEGEAAEVNEAQPWLTYGAPLHRLREWGTCNKMFDLLDERPLAQHELPGFASLILGEAACDGLPHPSLDWAGFLKALDKAQASAKASSEVFTPGDISISFMSWAGRQKCMPTTRS